jgi:hypothetical protein
MPILFKKQSIQQKTIARSYQQRPTLADRLPWRDYNETHQCFLLEDNESLGVCFKIIPVPCEARPEAMMENMARSISEALKNAVPLSKEDPWIVQVYASKEAELATTYQEIEDYFPEHRKDTPLTQAYLNTLCEHFDYLTRPGGVFQDTQVMQLPFRGGTLRVYAVLYRRLRMKASKHIARQTQLKEMRQVSRKFAAQLRACGLKVQRMDGKSFYAWMAPWFNPLKKEGSTYPEAHQKMAGHDLAEQLFYSVPESFTEGWLFQGMPHKVLTIQYMTSPPAIGHLSAERKRNGDDKVFHLIDHLPEGSVFVITFQAPSEVALHLKTIHDAAVGRHALALKVKQEVHAAEKAMAHGDCLFPVVMAVYVKGETLDVLHEKEAHLEVLLNSNGFKVITEDELFPVDAYLRYLPMCYDFYFDQHHTMRSHYLY